MKLKRFWNKYTRAGLIIFVGLAFALIAAVINQNNLESQIKTKQIIMTKEDIPPYKAISKDQLEYQDVIISAIPEDAILNADNLDFTDLYTGEYGFSKASPLRKNYLTTAQESKLGSALGLSEGMVEVGIQTTLAQSAGDGTQAGVYVEAIAILQEEQTGQTVKITKKENPNLAKLLVIRRLNTEGLSPKSTEEKGVVPSVVVVEATPEQAADLVYYQEKGKVYLTPAGVSSAD
ncbi:hypothetical protein D3C74_91040 [compost metagenome]